MVGHLKQRVSSLDLIVARDTVFACQRQNTIRIQSNLSGLRFWDRMVVAIYENEKYPYGYISTLA